MTDLQDFVYILCTSNATRRFVWGLRQKKEIISVAAEQIGRRGYDLESTYIGIQWKEDADGQFHLEREATDDELFAAALEELRHDGHTYDVYEDTAEGRAAFVAALPASLRDDCERICPELFDGQE